MTELSGFLLLSAAAFAAGLVDAIGGGGGLITLPALLATGMPPHLALGTNKGQSTFGALASFLSYWRRGLVEPRRAVLGFAAGLAGSCAGALIVLAIPAEPLKPTLAVLLVAALAVALWGKPSGSGRLPQRWRLATLGIAFGLGAYDGFFGPGTGSLLIIAMSLSFGDGYTRASANAKVVNLASNLAALAVFGFRHAVLWPVALAMAVGNALGAFVGARIAIQRGDRWVRWVVVLVVCATVVKLVVDALTRAS